MPAKSSRRSRQSQAKPQRLLTFQRALEAPWVEQAFVPLHEAWRKRRDKYLRRLKNRHDAATNPRVWQVAADAEHRTKDLEPSAEKLLISKLRDGSLPFFVRDAVGNTVEGDPDLDLGTLAEIRRCVLIDADDLKKAFHKPKSPGKRGPPPNEKSRVKEKMRCHVNAGTYTVDYLRGKSRRQKDWAAEYECTRTTFLEARKELLSELETPTNSDKK
jgi:hypothetical protein